MGASADPWAECKGQSYHTLALGQQCCCASLIAAAHKLKRMRRHGGGDGRQQRASAWLGQARGSFGNCLHAWLRQRTRLLRLLVVGIDVPLQPSGRGRCQYRSNCACGSRLQQAQLHAPCPRSHARAATSSMAHDELQHRRRGAAAERICDASAYERVLIQLAGSFTGGVPPSCRRIADGICIQTVDITGVHCWRDGHERRKTSKQLWSATLQ